MVPPTDMEKQQVATEARKHMQDIKKNLQKKITLQICIGSINGSFPQFQDVDYLSAGMLLDFSLDLSSDDEKPKQTKFHVLKMKQISTDK